jgi:hypothetical protein
MRHDPLDLLPAGITIEYLRRLTGVSSHWAITIDWDPGMDPFLAMRLECDYGMGTARIYANSKYIFSGRALARGIAHELYELADIQTWLIFKESLRQVGRDNIDLEVRYRTARDAVIEQRLQGMPFWGITDIPVPQQMIGSA